MKKQRSTDTVQLMLAGDAEMVHRLRAEHGLSAAGTGRLVASADRAPPRTTLRCAMPTSPNGLTVIL